MCKVKIHTMEHIKCYQIHFKETFYEFINFQRLYCLNLVSESTFFDKGISKN